MKDTDTFTTLLITEFYDSALRKSKRPTMLMALEAGRMVMISVPEKGFHWKKLNLSKI